MQNVGLGDVFFILLIFGVIHGIMYLVGRSNKRTEKPGEAPKQE